MRPNDILNKADYERPRTLPEFEAWWQDRFEQFGESREGRAFARESKSDLVKRFHQEAHPMLSYMRHRPPAAATRVQIFTSDGAADAMYLDPNGAVLRKFQITMPMDGRTEKKRMRQLSRVGHVDALADLDDNDEVPETLMAFDKHARMRKVAERVKEAIEKKSGSNKYNDSFTLIVGLEDNTYDDEDDSRLFREFIGPFNHTFREVHVAGILGRVLLSYPESSPL